LVFFPKFCINFLFLLCMLSVPPSSHTMINYQYSIKKSPTAWSTLYQPYSSAIINTPLQSQGHTAKTLSHYKNTFFGQSGVWSDFYISSLNLLNLVCFQVSDTEKRNNLQKHPFNFHSYFQ
jgi:hypothetical protein